MPSGVHVRSDGGVQVEFSLDGARRTETIDGRPTVQAVRDAASKREAVLVDIKRGVFRYEAHFPNSRKVRQLALAEASEEAKQAAVAATTMGELFDIHLARYIENNPGNQNTHHTHCEVVRSHLRAAFGSLRPNQVTPDLVITFRSRLRDARLSDSRISNVLTPLRATLTLARERGLIAFDPFDQVSPTKPKKQQVVKLDDLGLPSFDEALPMHTDRDYARAAAAADPFDSKERQSILAAMRGQVRNLVAFAFWTGLRTGELIALRWCDIDWSHQRVCVRLSFSKKVFTPTKGKRVRWVPLLPPALRALRNQQAHTGEDGRWVFHNPATGDRWSSSERLRRRWVRALRAAGVRYRYQYQMRHSYASARMSAGDSAFEVAEALGHLDPRLVSVVYARFQPPGGLASPQRLAQTYDEEWALVAALLTDNADEVTAEDVADESLPDGEAEDQDPVEALNGPAS